MSANLDTAINELTLRQDIELNNALTTLKNNPAALNSFIQQQKTDIVGKVMDVRNDTFTKVYGDMVRASDVQKNIYYYYTRNHDINDLQGQLLEKVSKDADTAALQSDTTLRQYEINEWTSSNRMDTLFFLQILFIALLVEGIFMGLMKKGILTGPSFTMVSFILFAVVVGIVVYRARYTALIRSNRYWNQRAFPRSKGPVIPLPNCPDLANLGTDIKKRVEGAEQSVINATNQTRNRLGNFLTNAGAAVLGGANQ
jgi:hypothetical protein